jgi:hypothetical protein
LYHNDFHRHMADVEALAAHGIAAPAEWLKLGERFAAYIELAQPISDRLASEILDPTGADVAVLLALSLAEQTATSVDDAAVTDIVRARVHGRMLELYRPHADKNYKQVADQFDAIADRFTRAAKTVDPESTSDAVVGAGDAARKAWFDAATLAADLDEWLAVLTAAARLAGVPAVDDERELEIALTVDAGKLNKRRVWGAWSVTGGRTGRWGALCSLDATLRAHGRPERLQPYAAPKPFEGRWVPGKFGGHEIVFDDPEDNPNAARTDADDWSVIS